jgi:hypothetical protein
MDIERITESALATIIEMTALMMDETVALARQHVIRGGQIVASAPKRYSRNTCGN